jgi:hypothetical protein
MAGFTIPNAADAYNAGQASPDAGDFAILTAGFGWTGVVSGCQVTPTSPTPSMAVTVAAGVAVINGVPVAVAGGTVSVSASHASYDRYDLVVVDATGTVSVVAGAAALNPVFPAIPANSAVLAALFVEHGSTAVYTNRITDKRLLLVPPDEHLAYAYF